MTVKQRVLALRLLEKQRKHPEYMNKIGVEVVMAEKPKILATKK